MVFGPNGGHANADFDFFRFLDFLAFQKKSVEDLWLFLRKDAPGDNKRPWKGVYFEAIPENCQKIRKVLETGLLKGNNKPTNQPTNQPINQPTTHDLGLASQGKHHPEISKNRRVERQPEKPSFDFAVNYR